MRRAQRRDLAVAAATVLSTGLFWGCAGIPAALAQMPEAPVGLGPAQAGPVKTLADSPLEDVSDTAGSTKTRPAFRLLPRFVPGSEDWSRPYADILDAEYDKWLAFKKGIAD